MAFTLHCLDYPCSHTGRVTFDETGLADDVVFLDIPRLKRFVCSRCGGRNLEIFPDWRDHAAPGNGRTPPSL